MKGKKMPDIHKYRSLWSAVLDRAIEDLEGSILERRYSKAWFYRDHEEGTGSYIWICDVLGIDPAKTRKIIFNNMKG